MDVKKALVEIESPVVDPELRVISTHQVGKVVRQGDIYLHMVADTHEHGKKIKGNQLVPGTSKGSRHTVDNADLFEGTTLPEWVTEERVVCGAFIRVTKRTVNRHPEHADNELPEGCYQVTHQMDARTWKKVID